jgi:hypothetical protein
MIERAAAQTRRALIVVGRCPDTFACWLRAVYPAWAPRRGHVALVALCGQEGSLLEQRPRSAT